MRINNKSTNIEWIFNIKEKVPGFLRKLQSERRPGFFKFSLSGDFFSDRIKWGLGNSVFFLKIIFTLGLEKQFQHEIKETINYILSYQKKDGSFYDNLIISLNFLLNWFKIRNQSKLKFEEIKRAETRQSISSLSLFNIKPPIEYKKIPNTIEEIEQYINKLNWSLPWGAGSHFSHLLFFLKFSKLKNKDQLIKYSIEQINNLQHENNGFWYKGTPTMQQKINGAMKIITGLKVVNKTNFKYPEKMITEILSAKNDEQACDNFNIIYVLKYCNELTESKFKFSEIQKLVNQRLKIYRDYFYPEVGGFSFFKSRANYFYYGAYIGRGKNEPDIHGTHLFLWGLSLISQILNINDDLNFKELIP